MDRKLSHGIQVNCTEEGADVMEFKYNKEGRHNVLIAELFKGSEADDEAVWMDFNSAKLLHEYLTDLLPIMAKRELEKLLGIET